MALFNEILVGRYNRALQKLLALKGPPPSPQLSPEIGVALRVPGGNEEAYLWGWGLYGARADQAAVALENSRIRIRNPVGSNVIAVITKISYRTGASEALSFEVGAMTVDLAALSTLSTFDPRGTSQPTCIVSFGTVVGGLVGTSFGFETSLVNPSTNFIVSESQEIPLLPGQGIQVRTIVVNLNLSVTYLWRERFLEESERA